MSINLNNQQRNNFFMSLALQQASKNIGNTGKNPSVGCAIVKKDSLISVGCTSVGGRPHAEFNAIKSSKNNINDSELYVTLEPCSNFGKTPPCVKLISKKKIKKVFFSIYDPDCRSFKKSIDKLKKGKIETNIGLLSDKIKYFYKSYIKFKTNDLPFVTAKLAISKDLFTKTKKNKWITNKYSRGRAHLIRSYHDCLITSIKTVIDDNPTLNCRISGLEKSSPTRVILDKSLKIPINSNIAKSSKIYDTIVFFNKGNGSKIRKLKRLKIKLFKIRLDENKNFSLEEILFQLKLLGFSRILLESGIGLTTSFFRSNLVDEFKLFVSGDKLKKAGTKSFKTLLAYFVKNKKKTIENVNLHGDKLITYRIR